jgi:hypothetical protein
VTYTTKVCLVLVVLVPLVLVGMGLLALKRDDP